MVSFPFWLFSLTDRQSLGLILPLIFCTALKEAIKLCAFAAFKDECWMGTASWTHWPGWTTEKGPVCKALTGPRLALPHTFSFAPSESYSHTRSHPQLRNANSCQTARMICPYSSSCPMDKQTQWSKNGCVHTAQIGFGFMDSFQTLL